MWDSGSSERHIWTLRSGLVSGMGGRRPGVLSVSSASNDGEKKSSAGTAGHSGQRQHSRSADRLTGCDRRWYDSEVMAAYLASLSSSFDLLPQVAWHPARQLLEWLRWLVTTRRTCRELQAERRSRHRLCRTRHQPHLARFHAPSSLLPGQVIVRRMALEGTREAVGDDDTNELLVHCCWLLLLHVAWHILSRLSDCSSQRSAFGCRTFQLDDLPPPTCY